MIESLVRCRSESEYAEKPFEFLWEGEELVVSEIIARWRSPEGKYFRVKTNTLSIFLLFYNEGENSWYIEPV